MPVAPPVAWGIDHSSGDPRSLIAFAEVSGLSLARWVAESAPSALRGPAALRRHAIAVASWAMPSVGCTMRGSRSPTSTPSTCSSRTWIRPPARRASSTFSDCAGRRSPGRRRGPGRPARQHPRAERERTDRLRVLRAYLGVRSGCRRARDLIRPIEAVRPNHGRDPRLRTAEPPAGRACRRSEEFLDEIDGGRLRSTRRSCRPWRPRALPRSTQSCSSAAARVYRDKCRPAYRPPRTARPGRRHAGNLPQAIRPRAVAAGGAAHLRPEPDDLAGRGRGRGRSCAWPTPASPRCGRLAVGEEITPARPARTELPR